MEWNPLSQRNIDHGELPKLRTKYPTLIPLGHAPNEVANALCRNSNYLQSKKFTTLQKEAIAELKNLTAFDPVTQQPEDYNIMYEYFKLFDKLLFFASLEGHCTLEMSPQYSDEASLLASCRNNHNKDGLLNHTPLDVSCTIIIYKSRNREDLVGLLNDYLASLIHEMIHAILAIYCCGCLKKCRKNTVNTRGVSGHGKAWHNILANFRSIVPAFLGRNLVFDEGDGSLAEELMTRAKSRNLQISDEQIRRWTPKVAKLLGITKYRIVQLWGYSLEKVASSCKWMWK